MGAGGNQGGGGSSQSNKKARQDTEVTGYEREIEKQKAEEKARREAFGNYDKSNTNPNDNDQVERPTSNPVGGEGDGNNQNNQKSVEQPKVKSQMDAVKPDTTPKGPTTVELSQDEKDLKRKRKGRRMTILTSPQGLDEDYTLSQKTLLG